jgi:RNA polymerase sigma-70 factor, ECF subfamily
MARPSAAAKPNPLRLVADGSRPETELPPPADRQLVACIRAGDEGAARAFHDRVRPRVDVTIRSLLGRGDPDHEDLVQLTMVALVETIDRYRGECSLSSWASLIAARVVYKEIRRRRRARRMFAPALESEPVASTNLNRAIVAKNLTERVKVHLERIHEDKAWTFLLHDVCGFTLDEIATITDASAAAAQKRLVRGRQELFERFSNDPDLADLVKQQEPPS